MASAYYSNTQHIDFESVLAMDDPVIYEAVLVDFFENASVRDGVIISTVAGQLVEISEEWFAESFDLPVDGLADLSEIPKDVVFDARSIVSMSGSKQAKGFAVQISLLLENIPNLELGESSEFPASKILTEKTVHCYVSLNDKVGAEEAAGAPKPKAASKKRPSDVLGDEPVVKKKRTMKNISSSYKVNLEIVAVAQEAVPIQMVGPSTAAPAAEDENPANPPADEVAGDTVDEEAADEGAYEETADGGAARKVLADTAQIRVYEEDQVVRTSGEGNQPAGTAEDRQRFDLPYDDIIARWDAERIVTTPSNTDEEIETVREVGTADGVQTESSRSEYIVEEPEDMEMSDDDRSVDELIDANEKMSLDEIILTIPAELPLPSAEREVTKITIGKEIKIPAVDEKTCLKRLANIQIDDSYFAKEELVLSWAEAVSTGVALQRKMYLLLKYRAVLAVAHCIRWDRPCCSILFEGRLTSHHVIPAYTIFEVSSQRQYDDTLPLVSDFFKPMKKRWADICIEAVELFVSGRLLPVVSINFCRSLQVVQPPYSFAPRQPTAFSLRVSQFCTVFIDYSLFSRLHTEDITSFVASIASERTILRNVQIAHNTVLVAPIVQLIDEHSSFDSTSDDISMDFVDQDTAAAASISLPAAPIPDVTKALNQLRASIEQISERDYGAKHKDTLLLHLHHLERNLTARLDAQDRVLGALHRDSNDQINLMSMDIKSSHKQLSTQISSNAFDVVDVRRVVRENHQELNAKVTSLEEQVAPTRHDLFDFSAQAQQTLNVITDQLSELVAYINRGGNDKKGEVSSSRPPPDNQNRGSGNTGGGGDIVRTTDIPQRDIDNAQRDILERLMAADRQRERERGSRSRSGSRKRRRY
ncbi:pentatricopeptide repeat-containing protein-like [Dorcoceras hygrometricum]|uniref:Pentatricopeptide repeat-containing protein-like n=1 Tax=Dorcoceras hygrometricum TaxID=472368 RepID=A0A2Z7BR04_9LAMI|nr:pentatricopeptide repeat-containing protein-like [Dorcoceras hygrometricum]